MDSDDARKFNLWPHAQADELDPEPTPVGTFDVYSTAPPKETFGGARIEDINRESEYVLEYGAHKMSAGQSYVPPDYARADAAAISPGNWTTFNELQKYSRSSGDMLKSRVLLNATAGLKPKMPGGSNPFDSLASVKMAKLEKTAVRPAPDPLSAALPTNNPAERHYPLTPLAKVTKPKKKNWCSGCGE